MSARIRLVAIVGPTAAGKSDAALALAERVGGEIVSCDSMAVYRGFDVGTAKPTAAERARVPHHLVDVADPGEPFTAARFAELADAAIAGCAARGAPVVVAGGTGLYLRALVRGLFAGPEADEALRARLADEARDRGWPALHERLAAVDAEAAARIHENDAVRITRALEVHALTGRPLSRHHAEHAAVVAARYDVRFAVLDPPRDRLDARIAARVDRMLEGGLVDETRRLIARFGRAPRPLGGLGYKETLAFLDGALDAPGLREAIRAATRQLARRQRTFFARFALATAAPGDARTFPSPEAVDRAWLAAFARGA